MFQCYFLFIIFFIATTCSKRINWNGDQSEQMIREEPFLKTNSDPHKRYKRMTNGKEVYNLEDIPYQVAIWVTKSFDKRYFCGGSIISNHWILTAAHCLTQRISAKVAAGITDRIVAEAIGHIINVNEEDFIIHEKFEGPPNFYNDIALIRLNKSLEFSDIVKPIQLINLIDADKIDDKIITISGWGITSDDEPDVNKDLETTNITILRKNECQSLFYSFGMPFSKINTSAMICANNNLKYGVCEGDSGGAAVAQLNGIPTQIGINSFLVTDELSSCESVYARMFTRVSSHLDWICQKTGVCRK